MKKKDKTFKIVPGSIFPENDTRRSKREAYIMEEKARRSNTSHLVAAEAQNSGLEYVSNIFMNVFGTPVLFCKCMIERLIIISDL